MKKFASLLIAALLVMSTVVCGFSTASAESNVGIDFEKGKGTINLFKGDNSKDKPLDHPVYGAQYTAYQIMSLVQDNGSDDAGTYVVNEPFKSVITDNMLANTGNSGSLGGVYESTDKIEALADQVEKIIKAGNGGTGYVSEEVAVTESTSKPYAGQSYNYTIKNLPLGVYFVVETSLPDPTTLDTNRPAANEPVDKKQDNVSRYVQSSESFFVNVPEWYQTENSGEWAYEVVAAPKDHPIVLDKTVKDSISGEYRDDALYQVGSEIPFKIETEIPDYGNVLRKTGENGEEVKLTSTITAAEKEALKLTFTDTFENMVLCDFKSIKIGVKGADPATELVEGEDYTIAYDKEVADLANNGKKAYAKFVIEVKWDAVDDYQGGKIVLDYTGKLTKDAIVGANNNTIKYEFKEYPKTFEGTYNPEPVELEDKVPVYTYELDLDKTFDGSAAGDKAKQVTFKILNDKKEYIPVWDLGDNVYSIDVSTLDEEHTLPSPIKGYEITLSAESKAQIKGLSEGTYFLEETKTAPGYSKLTSLVEVYVEAKKEKNKDGVEIPTKEFKISKANTYENAKGGETAIEKDLKPGDYTFSMTINNVKKQFILPTTGGLGLWIFTLAGGVVMAAAIIFFTTVRRKKESE